MTRQLTDEQLATDDLEELVASICRTVQDEIPEDGGGKFLPNVGFISRRYCFSEGFSFKQTAV